MTMIDYLVRVDAIDPETMPAGAMAVRPPLMLTHAPGHMFLTDLREAPLT